MNHSSPQILCVSAALRLLQRDSMSATIVVDDLRVIDGNVSSSLLKISYRIALSGHHTRNHPVSFNQAPIRLSSDLLFRPLCASTPDQSAPSAVRSDYARRDT